MDFPDTRWTLISQLGEPDTAKTALDRLCATYWAPIHAYLLRSGRTHAEAQDLTQDFLVMVVRQRLLERADPLVGRLRSWLLAALQNFLLNTERYENRQKRGADKPIFSIQDEQISLELESIVSRSLTPDEAFDRAWIAVMLRQVLETLRQHYLRAGKEKDYLALLPWLLEDGSIPQAQAATAAGMTVGNFRVQIHRLRGRYREILHREMALTISPEDDYEEELAYLFRISSQRT